jgi:hypothetical protein
MFAESPSDFLQRIVLSVLLSNYYVDKLKISITFQPSTQMVYSVFGVKTIFGTDRVVGDICYMVSFFALP